VVKENEFLRKRGVMAECNPKARSLTRGKIPTVRGKGEIGIPRKRKQMTKLEGAPRRGGDLTSRKREERCGGRKGAGEVRLEGKDHTSGGEASRRKEKT